MLKTFHQTIILIDDFDKCYSLFKGYKKFYYHALLDQIKIYKFILILKKMKKQTLILLYLFLTIQCYSQIFSSHLYISDEFSDLAMHNYVEKNYEIDSKIANYLTDPKVPFVQKIGIVDLMNSKDKSYLKSYDLFLHFCNSSMIRSQIENEYVLNLIRAKFDIHEAFKSLSKIDNHNTLSKFLIYKYIELNALESQDSVNDNMFCKIYKDVFSNYNKTLLSIDISGDIKELFFDVFTNYSTYCSKEELIVFDNIERKGYSKPKINNLIKNENRFKLKYENGVYKIPVYINEAFNIDFIFDSGASDVLISYDVFSTLIRMGKIKESDLREIKYYTIADGSTIKSQTFLIQSLRIGDITVHNVLASVSGIEADLLLGQSFQKKFKKVTIDNISEELVIIK